MLGNGGLAMSGGKWDYINDRVANELFGYYLDVDYGLADDDVNYSRKLARKINPLEDKLLSELVFDVLCLLHSYDWYVSGDNCEDVYKKDKKYFKQKWLKGVSKDLVTKIVEEEIERTKEELISSLVIE